MIPAVTDELRRELAPGESLVWSGQPRQGICIRSPDIILVPFSLLWTGFAFYWEASVLRSHATILFVLWGLPFIAIGLYLIFGRFLVDSVQRSRTYYGLTDRRALVVSGVQSRQVKSLDLHGPLEIGLMERPDRSGTITFGPHNPIYGRWAGTAWPGKFQAPMFELIDEARSVYDQVRRVQDGLRREA